jgi:hypothetical protein
LRTKTTLAELTRRGAISAPDDSDSKGREARAGPRKVSTKESGKIISKVTRFNTLKLPLVSNGNLKIKPGEAQDDQDEADWWKKAS